MVALRLQIAAATLAILVFSPLAGMPAPPLPDTPPLLPWLSRPGAAALLWLWSCADPPAWVAPLAALLIHAANTVLLAALLRALFTARAAALAALIYAVHPLHADSLAQPQAAATLPAVTLALLAVLALLHGRPRAGTASALCALLFEPAAAAIPPALLLLAGRMIWSRRTAWLTAAGAAAWLAALVDAWPLIAAEWPSLGIFALRAAFLALFPLGLTPMPDLRASALECTLAALAVAAAAWIAWTGGRRHAAGAWFLAGVALLASVFFLPMEGGIRSLALPLAALAAFLALMLEHADVRLSAVYIVALCALAFSHARLWRDPVALWMEAARLAPRLAAPALQLAPHLPPQQALELLLEARRHAPADARLAVAAGQALLQAKRAHEALAELDRALELDPRPHTALAARAGAWLELGRPEAARMDLLRALDAEPCSLPARLALARLGEPLPPDGACRWTRAQRRALAHATSDR